MHSILYPRGIIIPNITGIIRKIKQEENFLIETVYLRSFDKWYAKELFYEYTDTFINESIFFSYGINYSFFGRQKDKCALVYRHFLIQRLAIIQVLWRNGSFSICQGVKVLRSSSIFHESFFIIFIGSNLWDSILQKLFSTLS